MDALAARHRRTRPFRPELSWRHWGPDHDHVNSAAYPVVRTYLAPGCALGEDQASSAESRKLSYSTQRSRDRRTRSIFGEGRGEQGGWPGRVRPFRPGCPERRRRPGPHDHVDSAAYLLRNSHEKRNHTRSRGARRAGPASQLAHVPSIHHAPLKPTALRLQVSRQPLAGYFGRKPRGSSITAICCLSYRPGTEVARAPGWTLAAFGSAQAVCWVGPTSVRGHPSPQDRRRRGHASPETPAIADTRRPETPAIADSRRRGYPSPRDSRRRGQPPDLSARPPAIMKLRPVLPHKPLNAQ